MPLIPIAVLALIQAVLLPARLWAKGVWVLLLVVACSFAGNILMRRDRASEAEIGSQVDSEIAKLKGLWTQWDAVARGLPQAGAPPAASFDSVNDALASLSAQVASIDAADRRAQGPNRQLTAGAGAWPLD